MFWYYKHYRLLVIKFAYFINSSLGNNLYNFAIVLKSENKVIGCTQLTNVDFMI